MKSLETTLLILKDKDSILLAKKKRGFGEGKYNGVGGKVESGETIDEAMIRECEEEILVTPIEYEKMGEIEFIEYVKNEQVKLVFHLYFAYKWKGEPKESDEMIPAWFNINEIPYKNMFPDDKFWLPVVLKGKKIKAFFEFDNEWNMISHQVQEIKEKTLNK